MKTFPTQEEGLLTDEEIEAILAKENPYPESRDGAPQPHLVESAGNAARWVKWLLFLALGSEFLLGMIKLFKP